MTHTHTQKKTSLDSLLPPIGEEHSSTFSRLSGFPLPPRDGCDVFDVHSLGGSGGAGGEGRSGGIASLSDGSDSAVDGDYLNRRRNVSYPRTEDGMPWRTHSDSTSSTVQSDDDRDGGDGGFAAGLGGIVDPELQCGVRCRSCLRAYDWPGSIELAFDETQRADSANSADAGADAAWLGFLARAFCGRLQHDREALWRAPVTVGLWELVGCSCVPSSAVESHSGLAEFADDAEIAAEAGGDDVDVEIWLAPHVSCAVLAVRDATRRDVECWSVQSPALARASSACSHSRTHTPSPSLTHAVPRRSM